MERVVIETGFAGANVLVEHIGEEEVLLRPDIRDTEGSWFYWAFRIQKAAGRTVRFQFTEHKPLTVRGAAVSLDGGGTWAWLNAVAGDFTGFSYAFPAGAEGVLLAVAPMYTLRDAEGFVGSLSGVRREVLCRSRAGREVPLWRMGNGENPRGRVLVTARHHCCETMGSFVLEGLVEGLLGDAGLMESVEVVVVPMVDVDGVEAGDQGKNRRPWDHNRDYASDGRGGIYPETVAIRRLAEGWSGEIPLVALDIHCPWVRGKRHEVIHQVGSADPRMWKAQKRFGGMLERSIRGVLPYKAQNDLPFGVDWNVGTSYGQGLSFGRWAAGLKGVEVVSTIEVPYANAEGVEVLPGSAREFGRDLARAVGAWVGKG